VTPEKKFRRHLAACGPPFKSLIKNFGRNFMLGFGAALGKAMGFTSGVKKVEFLNVA
jgi:hypothetical protein